MRACFYRLLLVLSGFCGIWLARFCCWWIATGYFFFFPARVLRSLAFYASVFPDKNWFARLWLVWQQFHRFADLFVERIALRGNSTISSSQKGWEQLEQLAVGGQGGILLMSHVGSWEVAAHLLSRRNVKLMLYMGQRQHEQVEALQKKDLLNTGVRLVVADQKDADVFSSLEGLQFVRSGGIVSFAGDRLWHVDQRWVEVELFGKKARLPLGPHQFALATGKPILIFFAIRKGLRDYHLVANKPYYVVAASRSDREQAMLDSAQNYARQLEQMVRSYPTYWFHFESFVSADHPQPNSSRRTISKIFNLYDDFRE